MEQQVPLDKPGVFSYDTYWDELRSDPSAKTNPDVGQVIDVGETLFTRIDQAYPTATEVDFAKRLVAGLAIHRLTVGDVYNEMGATAAELRDSLCLYLPGIEQLPGEKSKNLETQIVAVLTKIRKTVNGQFFSKNKANDQFFLDLKKTEDFDAYIENKIPLLTDDSRNGAYREAMLQILEETDMQQPNIQMWRHELKWLDRNVNRPGWMFLGSPNERETAKPPLDYYMYFIQPYNPPKQKKEYIRSDEVLFILQNADGDFDRSLNYYAAAIDLHASATGNAKNVYKLKADGYLREMQTWLKSHFKDAYIAQYNGQSKPMMDWLKGTSVRNISGLGDSQIGSLKDIFESVASHILANHFVSLAPEYPTFSQWITYENIESAAKDALSVVSGVLARFRPLQILAPLVGDDLGLDANLGPVSLNHLRHAAGVRVVRTLYRHRPQIDGEAFFQARFFQQLLRLLRIVGVVLNVVVIAPHGRRDQVLRRLACALVNRFDDRFFVDRVGQRLTYFDVVQRFLLGVKGEITNVQTRLFQQGNVLIFGMKR